MIEVRDLKDPTGSGASGWYAAWCTVCGRWVSKFDWTPEDARRAGTAHDESVHGVLTLDSA